MAGCGTNIVDMRNCEDDDYDYGSGLVTALASDLSEMLVFANLANVKRKNPKQKKKLKEDVWDFNRQKDKLTGLPRSEIERSQSSIDHIVELQMFDEGINA